jgi:hypothetical protein
MLSSLCSTGASVFFVNMIAVSSFGACGLELSMFVKYAVTIIMNMIQPQAMRTQRQLDTGKKPPSIDWGQRVPPIVFIFLVSIMYMPIVPIMEFFGLAYFGCMYVVWRHQCLATRVSCSCALRFRCHAGPITANYHKAPR